MIPVSTYWRALADGTRAGCLDRVLRALLAPLSLVYALVQLVRAELYSMGILSTKRLPRPVVSVGNITVGGTGKTPVTAHLARLLLGQGLRVAVLSRGYGGTMEGQTAIVSDGQRLFLGPKECGDEPFLLASTIPGVMVVMGADRHAAGLLAMEQLSPDIFLLDDGFQHLRLFRDLNVLLLDSRMPFATGLTLPAGLLREPRSAARRADFIVYTRSPENGERPDLFPDKPSCWTKHRLSGILPLTGGDLEGFDLFAGCRIMAFSGIAEPESFYCALESVGVKPVTTLSFPDHTPYGEQEIAAIMRLRDASRSTFLVTTEKDAVKLMPYAERLGRCFAAVLEISFDDARPLATSLEKLLCQRTPFMAESKN